MSHKKELSEEREAIKATIKYLEDTINNKNPFVTSRTIVVLKEKLFELSKKLEDQT